MLPNPHHLPPVRPQRPRHQPVPRLVPRQLRAPERPVLLRHRPMPGTPMPETAIHEHRHPFLPKHKIRLPEHPLIPPPPRDPLPPKPPRQRQLRRLVPPRPHPRHHLRPLLFGEDVSHAQSLVGLKTRPCSSTNIPSAFTVTSTTYSSHDVASSKSRSPSINSCKRVIMKSAISRCASNSVSKTQYFSGPLPTLPLTVGIEPWKKVSVNMQ